MNAGELSVGDVVECTTHTYGGRVYTTEMPQGRGPQLATVTAVTRGARTVSIEWNENGRGSRADLSCLSWPDDGLPS